MKLKLNRNTFVFDLVSSKGKSNRVSFISKFIFMLLFSLSVFVIFDNSSSFFFIDSSASFSKDKSTVEVDIILSFSLDFFRSLPRLSANCLPNNFFLLLILFK